MAAWLHRSLLAGLLLATYLFAWTPARTAWTHGTAALFEHVLPAAHAVSARASAHTVRIQHSNDTGITYRAPAGIKFLLPGLFLVLIAPVRPRLFLFLGGHLGLGLLTMILILAAARGCPGGLAVARFLQSYGLDTYSLAVPVLLMVRSRN
jgi:hypothetical protein